MSSKNLYRAACIESLVPDLFGALAIYLQPQPGNFVLYKGGDRLLNDADLERLRDNGVQFVFLRAGDMDDVNRALEERLGDYLADPSISPLVKGKVLYQTAVNYVAELFEAPGALADHDRCLKLVNHIMSYVLANDEALAALTEVANHSSYAYSHSVQVAALSIALHSDMFLVARDELIDVATGSLLHDIGLLYVPPRVLERLGSLTDLELKVYRRHVDDGFNHLKGLAAYNDVVLSVVRHHHERLNGTGYPNAAAALEIPRSGQLGAVCDVYATLTSRLPGRPALSPAEAIARLRTDYARSLNQVMVDRLAAIVTKSGPASAPSAQLP